MNSLLRVFRYELRRQGRRSGYLLMTLGIPIIALVIFYGIRLFQQTRQGGASTISSPTSATVGTGLIREARPAGVVDLSGILEPSRHPNLHRFNTVEEAQKAIQNNEIGSYYVVAQDYVQSGKIDMYFDRFNIGNLDNSALSQWIVQSLVDRSGKQIDPALINRLQAKQPNIIVHNFTETGSTSQATGEGASFALVYIFSFMLLFSAFTTSGYLMQSVVEEKESRMVELILSSMRPVDLLVGKILTLGLLGLVQMILWGMAVVYIIRQIVPVDPSMIGLSVSNNQLIVLFIYFVLGYLFFSSIYAAIGAVSNNMREGPQLAGFVTLPATVVPFWGVTFFTTAPNGPFATFLSIFPLTSPLSMVMRVAVSPDVPLVELLASIVLLALTVLLAMWVAGRLFRVSTLLSGQVPRLRELPRLVWERG